MPPDHEPPAADLLARRLPESQPDQTLRREVADRLITAVAIGDTVPGQRFPSERDLATALGVGRVTVRAAVRELVDLGLLRSQQGRGGGTFVVEADSAEASAAIERVLTAAWARMVDQHEAESWLHGTIAAAAAERHTADDVTILAERLEDYRTADSGAPARAADERLHLAIAEAAHNPTLAETLLGLERQMHVAAPGHPWGPEAGWRALELRSLDDHRRLIAAIRDRDRIAAFEIGRAHARINMELLEAAMGRARTLSEHVAR
ncbi:FadR/GntR family transcriptional regulator [Agromyces archimandritae]|uniref:FadR family transcriptional regulator n=1 Tax=Agromyces archimandritae TaxID=2781962 RepID=A0A975FNG4_9MICO|nr:GntR family transcriptional regulator [Agromyces archimandritae]QTX05688.1 FadR family transcriptional regulator [Agromyces archimandritae]